MNPQAWVWIAVRSHPVASRRPSPVGEGDFGAFVLQYLAGAGALDAGLKIRTLHLPDVFQDQDSPAAQYAEAGLDAEHIAASALKALGVASARGAVRA